MTGYVLGLSFGFHDASAAIVSKDGVLAFAAEERLSRQKTTRAFLALRSKNVWLRPVFPSTGFRMWPTMKGPNQRLRES